MTNSIDLRQRLQQDLTDNTDANHKCSQCGECCSDTIALVSTDIRRIKAHIRRHNVKPQDHLKLLGPIAAQTIHDAVCPFCHIDRLAAAGQPQKAHCTIYPVRPAVCRSFTCSISSDRKNFTEIVKDLDKHLTADELRELANARPVSMRATFFPDK